jgi:hypothetical protein
MQSSGIFESVRADQPHPTAVLKPYRAGGAPEGDLGAGAAAAAP